MANIQKNETVGVRDLGARLACEFSLPLPIVHKIGDARHRGEMVQLILPNGDGVAISYYPDDKDPHFSGLNIWGIRDTRETTPGGYPIVSWRVIFPGVLSEGWECNVTESRIREVLAALNC